MGNDRVFRAMAFLIFAVMAVAAIAVAVEVAGTLDWLFVVGSLLYLLLVVASVSRTFLRNSMH